MKKYILSFVILFLFSLGAVAQNPSQMIYCGGENPIIENCVLGGFGVGTVYDIINNPDLLNVYDDCTPPPSATPPTVNAGDGGWFLGSNCDPANNPANVAHTVLTFDYECDIPSGLFVPFNESCAPIDVTVGYLIEFDYAGTCCDHDGIFNFCGAYTGTIIPIVVTIAPFYNIAQFVDYSGACGDQAYAIGIDNACIGAPFDGDIAAPTLGEIDDCGGPNGTPDFDDPEICLLLTSELDATALVPANPACITNLPYTSAQDLNDDKFWDATEIASAAGLPSEAAACYIFWERAYTPTADCLPPLLPPTLDML